MPEKTLHEDKKAKLDSVVIGGELFYKISDVDVLRPFFMSLVSDSDHWMFLASNGGITAGRKNAEYALFPYYTDDKVTGSAEITGSKSIFQVVKDRELIVWEPFSERFEGKFQVRRNLYKNAYGNKIVFEEINVDLELLFQYQWNFSSEFGFVKKSRLVNSSRKLLSVNVLDGIQNIVPYGVGSELQNRASNLADAYKRSELDNESGLGIFALSAIIVDKAEPSEALKASVAFSVGLDNSKRLLSSLQLHAFRNGRAVSQESDIKAEKGAYFVVAPVQILPDSGQEWMVVADVNKNHSAIVRLAQSLGEAASLQERIQYDIDQGTENLAKLAASADGLQCSEDALSDSRHFSNVLFNILRGGVFDDNYQIERRDFLHYLEKANRMVAAGNKQRLDQLPAQFSLSVLKEILANAEDPDFIRLATEYLPLKFSRRHGDPSRPWNKFSINIRNEADGSKILDYEGNWRDIFQNWEALAHSFPGFLEGMIFKFLNASTFDGYNPYRVTKDGFDWETIEPDDPWSYIGYWGDHQIIYLLKFLEFSVQYRPELLKSLLDKEYFVYANVPYRIKPYREMLTNPKDTIDFDFDLDEKIRARKSGMGADGALLTDKHGKILHVNFMEKLLATVLAKLSNFIPEGGIWMNTQRPEWNDANNALVGNGVSMVTLYYLRRFMRFFQELIAQAGPDGVRLSGELADFYEQISETLVEYRYLLNGGIGDEDRKRVLDGLGLAASNFRQRVYTNAHGGVKRTVAVESLGRFAALSIDFIDHSIRANRREDHLYHGYNLMTPGEDAVAISPLYEMLEGQVAVLSSGCLSAAESVHVLDALRCSAMFRDDQGSYMLYPNKNLPGFLQKNTIAAGRLAASGLLEKLSEAGNTSVLEKDIRGNYHFNGNFRNANDLEAALKREDRLSPADQQALLALFEEVFNHKAFTGRSGTFFGYEGLGSIYWHMVSKLRLAVQETLLRAMEEKAHDAHVRKLLEHYYDIRAGIGVHKSPELYGAFPTDPYSHTPLGKGAQQPGMTGQVKEDILCRFGELGVFMRDGKLHFQPDLLRTNEFLSEPKAVTFFDVKGERRQIALSKNALFFTWCQVPVTYELAEKEALEVFYENGNKYRSEDLILNQTDTWKALNRTGEIRHLNVFVNPSRLVSP